MRLMAHRIVLDGREYPLSILTVDADGRCSVQPYEHEVHSVRFYNGTLTVGPRPSATARPVCSTPCQIWQEG